MSNFDVGQTDTSRVNPTITQETTGPRCAIQVTQAQSGRGEPTQPVPYLMPTYHGRNGSNERTVPAIQQTPLGGMMPGPFAIAPAVVVGQDYRAPVPNEGHGFGAGLADGYPEGLPIPHSI